MTEETQAPETEVHLKDYLRVLVKRRWTVLAAFVIVVTATAVVTFRQPAVYEGVAQLLIEKENPNILSIKEVMELDAGNMDYYQTQYKILQSRSLAQQVIDRLGLGARAEFLPEPGEPAPSPGALIDAFLRRTTIEPLRNTRLVNVRLLARDPELAAAMANALAELYIGQNLRQKVETTQLAGDFLSEQSTAARRKLEEAEQALQGFNERNNIVSLEERQNLLVQKLEDLNTELTRARTARIELETRIQQLRSLEKTSGTAAVDSMSQVLQSQLIQSLKTELARLEGDLAEQERVYTAKHPKIVSLTSQIQTRRRQLQLEIERVVQSLRNEYEVALGRERSLAAALEEQKQQVQQLNKLGIEYGALRREVENNRRIFEVLVGREKETGVVSGIRTNNIRIVDRAEIPAVPVSPRKARNLALGLVLGLAAGVGLAFFLEYLDDSVKDPDDLARHVRLPFLGPIPVVEGKKGEEGDRTRDLLALRAPKSIAAEAYRAVRTSLLFSSPDNPPRTFLVTSPGPQEGKTTTAVNLAITMARTGSRVLLVDADLRKPRLHKIFGFANGYGLSSLVGGAEDVGHALHATAVPTLTVMTSGPIPPNPSELLGSARMGELLALLRGKFDRIVIDTTPLIAVTDATVLAARADGVILVIKAGATGRQIVQRSKKQLEEVQAKIVGAVLNWVDIRRSTYYYSQYYAYGYYGEEGGSATGGGKAGGAERRKRPRTPATPGQGRGAA